MNLQSQGSDEADARAHHARNGASSASPRMADVDTARGPHSKGTTTERGGVEPRRAPDGKRHVPVQRHRGLDARRTGSRTRGWARLLSEHDNIIDRAVADADGIVVKHEGDGAFAVF